MTEVPDCIFDVETHTYSQGGVIVPRSVTGLLKKYGLTPDYSDVPRHVLDLAAQRGRALAQAREMIVQGIELDPESIDERIMGYVEAFKKFWRDSGATLIETEVPRVSPLGFGFRADLFCWLNGKRTVIDDKATFKLPKSVGPQTAGYKIGWNSIFVNEPVENRMALWLKKSGDYKAPILDDPDDEVAFMDCLEADIKIENWKLKYGGNK